MPAQPAAPPDSRRKNRAAQGAEAASARNLEFMVLFATDSQAASSNTRKAAAGRSSAGAPPAAALVAEIGADDAARRTLKGAFARITFVIAPKGSCASRAADSPTGDVGETSTSMYHSLLCARQ